MKRLGTPRCADERQFTRKWRPHPQASRMPVPQCTVRQDHTDLRHAGSGFLDIVLNRVLKSFELSFHVNRLLIAADHNETM